MRLMHGILHVGYLRHFTLLAKTIFSHWQNSAEEPDSNRIKHYEAGFIKKGESAS